MKPKEAIEIRLKMVDMHNSVLKRIDEAYRKKQYIEVCWLCYACFESRVNRVLAKICDGCSKEQRVKKRNIGISTKLECYTFLIKMKYPPLQNEDFQLINTIKGWCKERNDLIHNMVSIDAYDGVDKKFASLAKRGIALVNRMYKLSANVREYYYNAENIPPFSEKVVNKCKLKYKCI